VLPRTEDPRRPDGARAGAQGIFNILNGPKEAVAVEMTSPDLARLLAAADVVIDCADSFAVTYVLSDACQLVARPLVSASVLGLAGYVGAFCGGGPSYRAVFPELPRAAGSCAASGVLGTAVGERQINAAAIGPAIGPKNKTSRIMQSSSETPANPPARCLRTVIVAKW